MAETDKYGKFIFDRNPFVPAEEATGINWAERIKQRQEEYEAEIQYLEDIESDEDMPGWKQAMRRLQRL